MSKKRQVQVFKNILKLAPQDSIVKDYVQIVEPKTQKAVNYSLAESLINLSLHSSKKVIDSESSKDYW